MEDDVVIIPRELFDRILMRVGIMSDSCARDICLDLEKCIDTELEKCPKTEIDIEVIKDRQIRFVDPFTFEIDEG